MFLLASNSPRRKQLLALTGWEFKVKPVDVDEQPRLSEMPLDYVLRLARAKAQAAASWIGDRDPGLGRGETLVVAADTTVVDGHELLGKPVDALDAGRMLRQLRGRDHQVFTALAMVDPSSGRQAVDWCATEVPMRDYSDEEMSAYIASGDPLDKAGAYAIQHTGFHPVEKLEGCYANVVGLPLCHLVRTARKFGLSPSSDVPAACQAALSYICPVYQRVLSGEGASG